MVLGIIFNRNLICYSRSQVAYPSNLVPPVVCYSPDCLTVCLSKLKKYWLLTLLSLCLLFLSWSCTITTLKLKFLHSHYDSYNSVAVAKMIWILVSLCLSFFFFFLASLVFHKSILYVCFQVKNQAHISCSDFLIFSNCK